MVTVTQAQIQAEHSSAERRLQTWPSVGFLPPAFCSLAEPGVGAGCVRLSSCLMTPAQAAAGLKSAKRKKRHKIPPAWCAFGIMQGIAQAGAWPALWSEVCWLRGRDRDGRQVAGGSTTWEDL